MDVVEICTRGRWQANVEGSLVGAALTLMRRRQAFGTQGISAVVMGTVKAICRFWISL